MRYLILILLVLNTSFAEELVVKDPLFAEKGVEITAELKEDEILEDKDKYTTIFLNVKNESGASLRIEPHFSSRLKLSTWKKYYKLKITSDNKFEPGVIASGEEREGYIYFKKLPQNTTKFRLELKGLVLYGKKRDKLEANWDFVPLSEKKEEAAQKKEELEETYEVTFPVPKEGLYIVDNEIDLKEMSIDIKIPRSVGRGEELAVSYIPQTGVEIADITLVMGTSDYTDLKERNDGSWAGALYIPEFYQAGTYLASVFVKFKGGYRRVEQYEVEVTD